MGTWIRAKELHSAQPEIGSEGFFQEMGDYATFLDEITKAGNSCSEPVCQYITRYYRVC